MNEAPKSIWHRVWSRPIRFFFWLALISFISAFSSGILLDRVTRGPQWSDGAAIGVTGSFAILFVAAFIGLILALIPPTRPLMAWAVRRWFFCIAALITLVALFYAEENVRGKWAWEKFKREWEAKGEHFDFKDFIPPPVPDDQNFAMTPLLKPVLDYVHTTNGIQWRDTNGYARLKNFVVYLKPEYSTNNAPALASIQSPGAFTDLEAWRNFYLGNTNYPQPKTSGTAAADILVALGKFDAEFDELQTAAATRPLSRFPIHYEEERVFAILLPHLAWVKGLCMNFQLRAIARLELHQNAEALADLQTGFRLSDSVRDEPFLIDHLVRIATLTIDLQGVREGLKRHAWNDAQLATIEKYLASLDVLAEYEKTMRGERSLDIAGTEFFRKQGFKFDPEELASLAADENGQHSSPFASVINPMPSGWWYRTMLALAKLHQDFTLAAVDAEKHRVFPEISNGLTNTLSRQGIRPWNILAKMLMPAFARSSMRSASAQSYVDEACIACALERYRIANGKLPDMLDALAPQFIEKIPNDVIDGKPLRYRLNADGSYAVYSIGWNQRDDGGIIPQPQGNNRIVDKSKDDWVWQMPGK